MSFKFWIFLFGMIFVFSKAAASDACSPIDYSQDLGPIRDQGEKDLCYADTAADMLTQKLRRIDVKFAQSQVSAVDVAYQVYRNPSRPKFVPNMGAIYTPRELRDREKQKLRDLKIGIDASPTFDNFETGYIDLAIHAYRNADIGVCTEADLPSKEGLPVELIHAVDQKFARLVRICADDPSPESVLTDLRNEIWDQTIQSRCHRQKIGRQKVIRSTDGILGDYNQNGTFTYFANKNGKRLDLTKKVRQALRGTIDEGLEHGSIVGIDISPAFLVKDVETPKLIREHARHSLSVVSREKINGQCYYKLRNSWGESCEKYNPKFKARCVRGEVMVTPEELIPNMFRAQYLE
jgi:hypothetical protein